MKNTLLTVVGPTGIGKTGMGIRIARHLGAEIVSADSRQIYREMKVGTAVPTAVQLRQVKHHFIQTISIHDYYNASMFEMDVMDLLADLFTRNSVALLVGGSGLYIDTVCTGIDDIPATDPEIRKNLKAEYEKEGIEYIRMKLKLLDPQYYQQADLRNYKRILKALEISLMTGRPYSAFLTRQPKKRDFGILKIGLTRDRQEMYETIDRRVDHMISSGLIDEAKALYKHRGLNSLNTVGYNELFEHFAGKISLEAAVQMIKRNSRRYAKRQLSWFARDREIRWFHPDNPEAIIEYIDTQLITYE